MMGAHRKPGVCTNCGQPHSELTWRCSRCRERMNLRRRMRYERKTFDPAADRIDEMWETIGSHVYSGM